MAEKQHETQKLHHEGTGGWFLDSREFSEWKVSENSTSLWIKGQSGTGKTVLSSTVIRELFNNDQRTIAVAYFYFDFRDKKKQVVEIMLRSIILQLSAQSPHPYAALDRLYRSSKGQPLPTYQNLVDVLGKILLELGRAYIVLDALDECTESHVLIQLISRLRTSPGALHVMLTSQPRATFEKNFGDIPQVALEFDTTLSDITLFVSAALRSNPDLEHLARHAEEIATKVAHKSHGMFRLAAYFLDELSRQKLDPNIEKILANLPSDLFGMYSRFLEPIGSSDFVHVARALRWLAFSGEPVTLLQLRETLAFNFADPQRCTFDPIKRGNHVVWICKWLQGLVTVQSGGLPSMDNEADSSWLTVVALAHSSVADYIVSDEFREKYKHDLRKGPSHTFLAQTCIGYLLHFSDLPLSKAAFWDDYPLALYAATYWDYHLLLCDARPLLFSPAIRLLESGSRQYAALNNLRDDWPLRPSRSPLFMCCEIGYTEGAQFLIENGEDVNTGYLQYSTTLQCASHKGHVGIIRLLLDNGAKVNVGCRVYGSALQAASLNGHTDIVQILLANGAEVNQIGGFYGTALQIAAKGGYTDIVHLLLENGAVVDKRATEDNLLYDDDDDTGSALERAFVEGHTDIVNLLLERGAEAKSLRGTALQQMSAEGRTDDTDINAAYLHYCGVTTNEVRVDYVGVPVYKRLRRCGFSAATRTLILSRS
ncbi:hypothetical protein DFH07DRAFT_923376 [Mycena maculata]|uniref:NACHT domain-containing protein n=1 Tax=Mycena maculata TaxID=230809 RepID=A0AAD7N6I7_9AGAR|nr:hypothetical protein DFH07DRAFT_923376 [Mycena maculata]